jgi:glycosyltransferase involved in cell wall biosynthesis
MRQPTAIYDRSALGAPHAINRNGSCGCGSGRRFKHCCGRIAESSLRFRSEALEAHRLGALGQAESFYRRALEEQPGDVDVLHMLGVLLLERLRYGEALRLIAEAATRTGWAVPAIRHNLGLVLAKLMSREANRRQEALLAEFGAWERARRSARVARFPLVTVVLPVYNHARYVAKAIASVTEQTYPHIELVVIDDGSTDGTGEVVANCLANARVPVRFISRDSRSAPAALNEGAALAQGQYLSFLNPNDYYSPERVSALVEQIADAGVRWGFSLVSPFVDSPQPDHPDDPTSAEVFWQMQRNQLGRHSNSFSILTYNLSVSTGNLFVERDLFHELGGFRDFNYNCDWDFCLRAGALAEPSIVQRPLYFYRERDSRTVGESDRGPKEDTDRLLSGFLEKTLSGSSAWTNPLSPHAPHNRCLLLRNALSAGMGEVVPVATLRSLTEEVRATLPSTDAAAATVFSQTDGKRKTALVVLGMHRAGTSALARVLNLCGAALPENLRPAKLDDNEKGFWEAQEIIELNERTLRQLGGSWDNVAFQLPQAGALVDDFSSDLRALLPTEYGNEETILIKDPRISALIPLWHGALTDAGYRPAYVVLLRHPMEVARSLRARGSMSVRKGLSLWLTHMKRIADFADTPSEVVHIRFIDLLEDWRAIVGRIADRLDVRLDLHIRAEEVDRFLQPALRRQVSPEDAAVTPLLDDPELAEIRSVYRAFLARCERDAGPNRVARP